MSDIQKIKKKVALMFTVNLILGIASILDSLPSPLRTQYLFFLLGGIVVLVSAISLLRIAAAKDVYSLGASSIQGFWICASMGLGYIVSGPAPYFQALEITWISNVIIGLILLFVGMYFLITTSKETGVPLSV